MTTASRSLATALWGARFASGLLPPSYTTGWDTTKHLISFGAVALRLAPIAAAVISTPNCCPRADNNAGQARKDGLMASS